MIGSIGMSESDGLSAISEADFQATVTEIAVLNGWTVFCTRDSRRSPEGEPDLRMVHPVWKRMIWAELKTEDGIWTPKQQEIARLLGRAKQEWYLWRPSHMPEIERVLSRPGKWGK